MPEYSNGSRKLRLLWKRQERDLLNPHRRIGLKELIIQVSGEIWRRLRAPFIAVGAVLVASVVGYKI